MLFNFVPWLQRQLRGRRPARRSRRARSPLQLFQLETRELLSTSIPINAFNWTSLGPTTVQPQVLQGFGPGPGGGGTVTVGGPKQFTGEVTAIAPDPSDVNHIYIGTGGGGVYSIVFDPTDPTGQTYKATPLTTNLTDASGNPLGGLGYIGALAIDPDNPQNIYAGTGDANLMPDSYAGKGILHSTDGGKTWTLEGSQYFSGYSIAKVQVDWTNSNDIFVAVTRGALGITPGPTDNCGIWRSTDGGATWSDLTAGDLSGLGLNNTGNLAFTDMIIDPQSENLLFAIGEQNGSALNGVYISPDAANPATFNIPAGNPNTLGLVPGTYPTVSFVQANGLPSGLAQVTSRQYANIQVSVGRITLGSGWRGSYTTDWVSMSDTEGSLLSVQQVRNGAGPSGTNAWSDVTPTIPNGNGKNNPVTSGGNQNEFDNVFADTTGQIIGQPPVDAGNYTNALAVDPNNTDYVTLGGGNSFVIAPVGPNNAKVAVDSDLIQNYYFPFIYPISSMQWAAIADVNTTGFIGPGGGGNFQAPPFDFARDVGDYSHVLVYDHFGNLYDGTDTGLWRYSVQGAQISSNNFNFYDPVANKAFSQGQWSNLNLNLPIVQTNSVGLVPNSNDTIFAGARGTVNDQFVDATGWTVNNPLGGFGGFFGIGPGNNFISAYLNYDAAGHVIVDPRPTPDPLNAGNTLSGQDVYVAFTYSLDSTIGIQFYSSKDGGLSYTNESQGLGLSDQRDPTLPMVLDVPAVPNSRPARLLLGADRLYVNYSPESSNNSWTVLNFSLPSVFQKASPLRANGNIYSIGAAASDINTLYLGVGSALLKTTNDGITWTDVTPATAAAGAVFTSITVDPNNANIVYAVSPNSYGPTGLTGRVWESFDGGLNWIETGATLPGGFSPVDPWSIALVPADPKLPNGVLLLGTDGGVFYSLNLGTTWLPLGTGLPDVAVRDLEYNPALDTLAAATYGRGVYELNLKGGTVQAPTLTAPATGLVGEDATLPFATGAVSVADNAVLGNTVQATLSVNDGTLTLAPAALAKLTFTTGTGTGDATMTFTGTVANINAALNGLVYTPTPGFTGADTLTFTVNDLGHTGGILGTQQSTTVTDTINVTTVHLVFTSTFPGTMTAGTGLPTTTVEILDTKNNPVLTANVPVSLAPTGPGPLSGTTSVTAVKGVATFSNLNLTIAGSYTLTASITGAPPITSTPIVVNPGAAGSLGFVGGPTGVSAGTPIPNFNVVVTDSFGNPVPGSVTVNLSANGPGALGGTTTATTSAAGVATFSGLTLKVAGSYTLTAAATGLSSNNSSTFTITAGAASTFTFPATPPSTTAGATLGTIVVNVTDPFGNLDPTNTANVTLAANGPGALTGPVTVAAVNGVATFTGLSLQTAGSYTLVASAPGLQPGKSASFTVGADSSSAHLAFEASPGNTPAGTLPVLRVDLVDSFGNLLTGSTAQVTLSAAGPGTLGGTTTATLTNGVAVFSGLTLKTIGTYTLTAASTGLPSITTSAFNVNPGPAALLAFSPKPANASNVNPIPTFKVNVTDAFGNLVANAGNTVSIKANGPGGFSAGNTSAVAVGGVATFSGLTLGTPGSYTLTASATGLPAVTSPTFTISVPAATTLTFPGTIAGAAAGAPIPDFTVAVLDQFGSPFTTPVPVTVSATGPGALSGTTTVTSASGSATFSGLVLQVTGNYTLTATSSGLTSAPSNSFTVTPGAAARLMFESNPSTITAGPLPTLNVDLVDAFGNLLTGTSAPVTLTATGPGPLAGTTTVTTTNGVASFTNLVLGKVGSYTLTAAAGGTPNVTTPAFAVTVGVASQLTFEPLGPVSITAGQNLPTFKVDVTDAFGNPVTSTASITVAPSVPGGITGTTTVAAVGGIATFTGIGLQKAGSYPLTASAGGLTSGNSTAVTVAPATPVGLVFETMPASIAAGQALTNLKVDMVDQFGNVATNSTSTVTLGANGPSAFSVGSNTAPTVNGIATFPALALTRPGSYTLTAAASGLTSTNSNALTVTSGAPAKLVFLTVPTGGAAGQTLPAVTVEVFDAFGNPVTNSSFLVTIAAAGGNGVLTGTLTVPVSNGLATFSDLVLSLGGTYTLTASLGGQAAVTSVPFAVSGPTSATTTSGGTTHVTVKTGLIFVSAPTVLHSNQTLPVVKLQLLNSKGKPLAHIKVTLQLKGGHLSGVLTKTTDAHGNVTFTGVKVGSLKSGKHSLVAKASNKQSASHTVTVGTTTKSRRG